MFSNCHINLGRKNKMGEAVETLKWLESRIVPKSKYDTLSDEEKVGKFPTGILKHDDTQQEYCKAYAQVIAKYQQGKRA